MPASPYFVVPDPDPVPMDAGPERCGYPLTQQPLYPSCRTPIRYPWTQGPGGAAAGHTLPRLPQTPTHSSCRPPPISSCRTRSDTHGRRARAARLPPNPTTPLPVVPDSDPVPMDAGHGWGRRRSHPLSSSPDSHALVLPASPYFVLPDPIRYPWTQGQSGAATP